MTAPVLSRLAELLAAHHEGSRIARVGMAPAVAGLLEQVRAVELRLYWSATCDADEVERYAIGIIAGDRATANPDGDVMVLVGGLIGRARCSDYQADRWTIVRMLGLQLLR